MKHFLTTLAVAALLAVPAFAQTGSQAPANAYQQQIQQAYDRMAEMPGGGNRERMDLEWAVLVAKANANRAGVAVDVPPKLVMSGVAQ